jgi:hypothetical protein
MSYLFTWSYQGFLQGITQSGPYIDYVFQENDLLEVVRPKKERNGDGPSSSQNSLPEVILRRNDFRSSTKLEALVQNLSR